MEEDKNKGTELAVVKDAASIMQIIAKAASDPAVDVSKMSALLDLQERLTAKRAEAEFNQAYADLQDELPRIKKDGTVEYPIDKNKPDGPKKKAFSFATWENVDAIIRPLLKKCGFSLTFNSTQKQGDGGGALVTGTLLHIGGHSKSASIPLALDSSGGKNNIQGMGSTLSYGKRYTTFMLLNIVTEGEDDDGVRGGMVFINDDEAAEVNKLIDDTGTNRDRFLESLKLANVSNIQKGELGLVLNLLHSKARAQKAKQS